ncbi:MAG: ATP-binding protein [Actinomycetota bacterium]|nr:ATP-binding protein [Actinomycetota bacterium]
MAFQFISEVTDCEYKSAVERAKPKSWLKTVSAFANTAGGTIAFGVDDETHEVAGLAAAQSDADFVSECVKARIDPLPRFEVEAESADGRDVLLVRVHADAHPPYYYCADGRREAYVRVGNQSVIALPEVLNELILRGTNRTWDGLD